MNISSRSRIAFVALVVFLVVSVVVLVGYQGDYLEDIGTPPPAVQLEGAQPSEVNDGETEDFTGKSPKETMEPARQIVHVPDTRRDTDDEFDEKKINYVSHKNIVAFTSSGLEKALAGELNAAIGLRRMRWMCFTVYGSAFDNDQTLDLMAQNKTDYAMRRGNVPPEGIEEAFDGHGDWVTTLYPTYQQNREYQRRWSEECSKARSIFGPELRKRLEKMARDGHVVARYIYATWRPVFDIEPGVFDRQLEWQLNSWDFSYANLVEGEPAGLVAFGESYTYFDGFTPWDIRLGDLLLKAALDCGLRSSEVERHVYRNSEDGSTLPVLYYESKDDVAKVLKELTSYCQ